MASNLNQETHINSYVSSGLTALGRNAQLKGDQWFMGHIGAATMAGGFMLESQRLTERAKAQLAARLDRVIEENSSFFTPFEAKSVVSIDPLVEAIAENCKTLSNSGHGVIYGTLALRALESFLDMAVAELIDGVVATLVAATKDNPARYYGIADHAVFNAAPAESDLATAIERAYRLSCEVTLRDQSVDGQHYFFAGEKIHGITHAQALLNLTQLDYADLARQGLVNLCKQLELNEQRPEGLQEVATPTQSFNVLDDTFWGQTGADLHIIKLAYSAIELNNALGDDHIELERLSRHFALMS